MKETENVQWAINWQPTKHSFAQLCADKGMSHQSAIRIVDKYITDKMATGEYKKVMDGKAIVIVHTMTGSQYYIEIEIGIIIANIPTVGNILVSSNVMSDLTKIINNE